MEHTKKLVLVEPRFVRPSLKDNALSKLDAEIRDILYSDKDDYAKSKEYAWVLRRYKAFENEPLPKAKNLEKLEETVLKSIPHDLQYKAKRILTQLGKDADVDFTSDGRLVYKQTPVDETNILDIVSDIVSAKPSYVKGTTEVAASLRSTKTPESLVTNPEILKQMKKEIKAEPRRSRRTRKTKWDDYDA